MPISPTDIRDWTIYKITSPSNRVYVGKTVDYVARLRNYKSLQLKRQDLIMRSLFKYGFKAHTFDIIDTFKGTGEYCEDKEMFWIRSYMSNICKYPEQKGMNMTDGGEGILGLKRSEEYKESCRQRNLGKKNSEHQKEVARKTITGNTYRLGVKQSAEEKEKRNSKLRGQTRTPEQRQRYKEAQVSKRGRVIIVYDSNTGVTSECRSFSECSEFVGMHKETIRRSLNGKLLIEPNIKNRRYTFKYK